MLIAFLSLLWGLNAPPVAEPLAGRATPLTLARAATPPAHDYRRRLGALPDDSVYVRQAHRKIVFQFDQRYSFFGDKLVGINGLKLGLEWRGRIRGGVGLYLLSPGTEVPTPVGAGQPEGTRTELRFRYAALYGEYVVAGTPRWEISTPVQVGVGKYFQQYRSPDGMQSRSRDDRVFVVEPSVAGHYRFFRWIGLGAGLGWREVGFAGNRLPLTVDGPIFYGRVKLFLGDLYKVARGRDRLFTQRGLRRADWSKPELDDE